MDFARIKHEDPIEPTYEFHILGPIRTTIIFQNSREKIPIVH